MSNQFLADFQFIGSSIKNLKIKNDFIALGNDDNAKKKIDISHAVTSVGPIDEGKKYSGTILLNIKVTVALKQKKYAVELSIEGCFNASAEVGEERFKDMLQINGITALYSIARGFIQSVTAQTVISGSVLLPMFNVAAYSKDVNAKQQKYENEQDN